MFSVKTVKNSENSPK